MDSCEDKAANLYEDDDLEEEEYDEDDYDEYEEYPEDYDEYTETDESRAITKIRAEVREEFDKNYEKYHWLIMDACFEAIAKESELSVEEVNELFGHVFRSEPDDDLFCQLIFTFEEAVVFQKRKEEGLVWK